MKELINLTENFKLEEFRCHDGTGVPYEYIDNVIELVNNLQRIRYHIRKPIIIISGYRNPTYNKKVNGSPNSQHMLAKAADIQIQGLHPIEIYQTIENLITQYKILEGGLGLYNTFVHYDIRRKKSRWKL